MFCKTWEKKVIKIYVAFPKPQLKSWNWIRINWQSLTGLLGAGSEEGQRSLERTVAWELFWPFFPEKVKESFFPLTIRKKIRSSSRWVLSKSQKLLSPRNIGNESIQNLTSGNFFLLQVTLKYRRIQMNSPY